MERLLEPDVLRMTVSSPVRKALLLWRWVAARAFFERGWTQIFSRAFGVLKGQPEGMWSAHLRSEMRDLYPDEQTVESLSQEVKEGICRSGWLTERFRSGNPKDSLLLLIAGLTAAQLDEIEEPDLDISQLGDNGAITVSEESERYKSFSGKICRDFWADTAIKTLLNHFRQGLKKLHRGNPDSLYVDYENGRWVVPVKAIRRNPGSSLADSRLDVALAWCTQLGIADRADQGFKLTLLGEQLKSRWDEAYHSWQ